MTTEERRKHEGLIQNKQEITEKNILDAYSLIHVCAEKKPAKIKKLYYTKNLDKESEELQQLLKKEFSLKADKKIIEKNKRIIKKVEDINRYKKVFIQRTTLKDYSLLKESLNTLIADIPIFTNELTPQELADYLAKLSYLVEKITDEQNLIMNFLLTVSGKDY